MEHRRKSPRQKVSALAMIYDAHGDSVMSCTVRDISATGAGLKLSKDVPLPQSFFLALTRDGNVRRLCEPVWQLSVVAGVRFSDGNVSAIAGHPGSVDPDRRKPG
jgi:hypothetical protein